MGFIPLALALWGSYDYVKSGGLFEQADAMMSGEGRIFGKYVDRQNERTRQ